MPDGDDLRSHALSSKEDFYEVLGVSPTSIESEIRRAYRKTALKYHPDKSVGNTVTVEKFHLLQIAYDVLSDPTVKELYDNARRTKQEKKEREQAFDGRRKWMKEDLERRESGAFKRKRDEEDEEVRFERELRRLAEDGKRRRKEREEALNRDRLENAARLDREENGDFSTAGDSTNSGGASVAELHRTVKVRWLREATGSEIDKDELSTRFSQFGKVENAAVGKDKRLRLGDSQSKQTYGSGVVVFSSVVGAHAAIEDVKKHPGDDFKEFESVYWASGKEPNFLPPSAPATPAARKNKMENTISGLDTLPSTPVTGNGLRKVPSFASFSGTPKGVNSPSLEELTMIRLKNAEKRRLEEQIRKEEAAATATEYI